MLVMTNDTLEQQAPVITINGTPYMINIKELESFIKQCEGFMSADPNGFETMTQIISDSLIDNASGETTIEELRPQLKFLRELGFLFKNFAVPCY